MTWADLFDRTPEDITEDDVRRALAEHRGGNGVTDGERADDDQGTGKEPGGDR